MTEDEERESSPRYLKERIDSLEWLLGVVVGTLSEGQKEYIEYRLSGYSRQSAEDARRRDTDPARDVAAIAYDLERSVLDTAEDSAGGFALYTER